MIMIKRKTRIITAISLLVAAALVLFLFCIRPLQYPASPGTEAVRASIAKTGRVVHAGGFLTTESGERVSYTNSYDALLNMYEQGNRVCEIDIRETADGVLVCAHGTDEVFADGCDLPAETAVDEYLETRIYGQFQPMTVEMLAAFMRAHPDLLIITDIIHQENEAVCRKIAEAYPNLRERFIIQIYHESEYEPIRRLGFPHIIYTLYRADDQERNFWKISRYAETHELVAITTQKEQFYLWKNQLALPHCGVPVMFHTVDDEAEYREMLRKHYVLGVYTDITERIS
ncbi:MAG TPA: hypothetical protein DCZ61_03860 [Lachnospiraceae bacterium]|nr:hypothetical protein [Lachnospiraceae bacterium]